MGSYRKLVKSAHDTPQSKPLPNRNDMVLNTDGGAYVFQVDDYAQLRRFLILGSESGTYYANAEDVTAKNVDVVRRCIAYEQEHPELFSYSRTVQEIVDVSKRGLAPKNTPAILALVLVAIYGDQQQKEAAYDALPDVCRTATHLFQFVALRYSDYWGATKGGFGRGLRRAVGAWYNNKSPKDLAYQLVKYRNREGYTHRDLLRLAHPEPKSNDHAALYKWVTSGDASHLQDVGSEFGEFVRAFEMAQESQEVKHFNVVKICSLIRQYNLPREALPTWALTEAEVWSELLNDMPLTAMIRNLGTMSKVGILRPLSIGEKKVRAALTAERIRKARVHPMAILLALKVYASGKGVRGNASWDVNPNIIDALNDAFYLAFENVEPTGKNYLVGVDVSGSMTQEVAGMPISSAEVSGAFSLMIKKTEPNSYVFGFANTFKDLGITARMRLDEVLQRVRDNNFGSTDCALAINYARQHKLDVDVFVIITDNETNARSSIHPSEALKLYRKEMNKPDAKLIVLATTATKFTIADPQDKGMLDVAGFSSDVFSVISAFAKGDI